MLGMTHEGRSCFLAARARGAHLIASWCADESWLSAIDTLDVIEGWDYSALAILHSVLLHG